MIGFLHILTFHVFTFCAALGEGVSAASSALKRLGAVEPINPGHGCSWAFAGYKGNHRDKSWVSQIYRPRYQGPAMISDTINTPAADMGKVYFYCATHLSCKFKFVMLCFVSAQAKYW